MQYSACVAVCMELCQFPNITELHLQYNWLSKLHQLVLKKVVGHLVGRQQQDRINDTEICHISQG